MGDVYCQLNGAGARRYLLRNDIPIYVTDALNVDRITSVPKSVLRYELDKVRSLNLETSLSQSCSPLITWLVVKIELNIFKSTCSHKIWLSNEQYEILEELVTCIEIIKYKKTR